MSDAWVAVSVAVAATTDNRSLASTGPASAIFIALTRLDELIMKLSPIVVRSWLVAAVLSLTAVSPSGLYAHDDHEHPKPQPVAEEELYRVTAVPERIVLTWKEDPSTTQAVTWRTDTTVETAVAQIALAEDGPLFITKAKESPAVTTLVKTDLGERHYHAVNFTGLEPDTLYVYRVGDGTNWSAWNHFRTASDQVQPFSFIYFGDAQNAVKAHCSRVFREAFSDAPRARFTLHAGDMINRGNRDAEWGEWYDAAGWVNAMIPMICIPGNHEYDVNRVDPPPEEVGKNIRSLARRWDERFEYPENGPVEFQEKAKETVYYLDFHGVRIIAMNSMEDISIQAKWLEQVLADNPNQWTIVTHHHPVYSASERRDNPELRDAWQPIYDKYRVDIVLQGHDHSYGRTGLMAHQGRPTKNVASGRRTRGQKGGTLYVVSVSGPKLYGRNDFDFVRRAEDTQLYQIITIDGDELRYKAHTATGDLYDAFTLRKRDGQLNQLINQVPERPENRRPDKPKKKKARRR